MDEALLSELEAEGQVRGDHVEHLKEALRSARTIATAMGIVMAVLGVDETEAFTMLSRTSQDTNRKLRVIADEVVRTGDPRALLAPARTAER